MMSGRETRNGFDDEAGFGTVEFVVLFPLVLFSLLLLVQLALWGHTRTTAAAAAQDAASLQATRGLDEQVVNDTVASHGLTRLRSFDVTSTLVNDGGIDTVVVQIDGQLPGIIALISLPVRATGVAPIEQFRP
jgi:hypothetical protein